MKVHDLKTWPDPFQAVLDGHKHHEIRADDRGFAVGDELLLREWEPNESAREYGDGTNVYMRTIPPHYTGRSVRVRVTYKSEGGTWGLPKGMCVMSIERDHEVGHG